MLAFNHATPKCYVCTLKRCNPKSTACVSIQGLPEDPLARWHPGVTSGEVIQCLWGHPDLLGGASRTSRRSAANVHRLCGGVLGDPPRGSPGAPGEAVRRGPWVPSGRRIFRNHCRATPDLHQTMVRGKHSATKQFARCSHVRCCGMGASMNLTVVLA